MPTVVDGWTSPRDFAKFIHRWRFAGVVGMFSLYRVPESRYVVHKIRGGDREYQHIVAGFAFKTNVVKQAYGGGNYTPENSSVRKTSASVSADSITKSKHVSKVPAVKYFCKFIDVHFVPLSRSKLCRSF